MKILFKGTPYLPEYRGLHDGRMVYVPAGGQVEVSDGEAAVLIQDFPGIFVAVRSLEAPPVDKMIRKARTK
jgi:hypothetical protein